MKKQFESLNSDKFSEQKLSIEAMMKQRGGKPYDTKEHGGDKVTYIENHGQYIKQVTWGEHGASVVFSDKPFEGVPSDHYEHTA